MADDCGANPICKGKDAIGDIIGGVGDKVGQDAIQNLANAVSEAVSQAFASLGTAWLHIGTPAIAGWGGAGPIEPGDHPEQVESFSAVFGWITWVGAALAVISLIIVGARLAINRQQGGGWRDLGALGYIAMGMCILSGAISIGSAIVGSGQTSGSPIILFLQNSIWWLAGILVVVSIMVGAIRMIWTQRGQEGQKTLGAVFQWIIVAFAGVTAVSILVSLADSAALWIIEQATDEDFASAVFKMFAFSAGAIPGAPLLWIIVGTIVVICTVLQMIFMFVRGAMIVLLVGAMPVFGSMGNMETGRQWFTKSLGWLIGFIAYKPAAAFVYAAGFQLVGSDFSTSNIKDGLLNILTGLTIMVLALVALPALMKLVAPMTGAIGSGGGLGAAMGVFGGIIGGNLAALPSGAAQAASGGQNGGQSNTSASPSTSESSSPSGSPEASHQGGQSQSPGGGEQSAVPVPSGAAQGGSGGAAGAASGSSGASSAAGGASGAAGGSAAGAGAAAGPAGLAAGAAVEAADEVKQKVIGTVTGAGEAMQNMDENLSSEVDGAQGAEDEKQ